MNYHRITTEFTFDSGMKNAREIKLALYNELLKIVENKISDAQTAITSARESRDSDTKSSAGDKYETGRAMVQQEIDNNEIQLVKAIGQRHELLQLEITKDHHVVEPGCLVVTNHEKYFISIAMGKLTVSGDVFYAISLASPVGIAIKDKRKGDSINFQGRSLVIKEVH